jgi:hypothetical protein
MDVSDIGAISILRIAGPLLGPDKRALGNKYIRWARVWLK